MKTGQVMMAIFASQPLCSVSENGQALFLAKQSNDTDVKEVKYIAITSREIGCLTFLPGDGSEGRGNIVLRSCNSCTDGSTSCDDTQGFYWADDGVIKSRYQGRDWCLDMATSGKGPGGHDHTVYLNDDCHERSNQKWHQDGNRIVNQQSGNLCMNVDTKRSNNIKGYGCHGSPQTNELFDQPAFETIKVKSMTMCLNFLLGGDTGHFEKEVTISKGSTTTQVDSKTTESDINTDIKASVSKFSASASAEVSTGWKELISSTSTTVTDWNVDDREKLTCEGPCYIYQGHIDVTLTNGETAEMAGPWETFAEQPAKLCYDYTPSDADKIFEV